MKIVTWIASHLGQYERFVTLQYAIRSIVNNTNPPDKIYLSFSIGENCNITKNNVVDTLLLLSDDSKIKIIILFKEQKTCQFDHYKNIYNYYIEENNNYCNNCDNDIITFMDDDDLYSETAFETIRSTVEKYDCDIIKQRLYCFGLYRYCFSIKDLISKPSEIDSRDLDCSNDFREEYACLIVRFKIIDQWFKSDLYQEIGSEKCPISNSYTDLIFKAYIDMIYEKLPLMCYINKPCYLFRAPTRLIKKDYLKN